MFSYAKHCFPERFHRCQETIFQTLPHRKFVQCTPQNISHESTMIHGLFVSREYSKILPYSTKLWNVFPKRILLKLHNHSGELTFFPIWERIFFRINRKLIFFFVVEIDNWKWNCSLKWFAKPENNIVLNIPLFCYFSPSEIFF